jgi:hypothetical protein
MKNYNWKQMQTPEKQDIINHHAKTKVLDL